MATPITATEVGQYVHANGLEIYYEEYGAGEPLILIHGGTITCRSWQPLIPGLSQQFRVLALDSRGHGRTANPAGELSYRTMAVDVAAFSEALRLDRPRICGYSDGGQIALEIGLRYPGLARAFIVGAAGYEWSDDYINLWRATGIEGPGQVNFEVLQAALPDLAQEWRVDHAALGGPDYWRVLLTQLSTMWMTPPPYTLEDFTAINEPTLVVVGDRDPLFSVEQTVEIYRQLPNGELAVLPNADHLSFLMTSSVIAQFESVILDFFARH
ncbi:MAG: alpha/beta hydrolase [Anaerolineae bacterium]